MKIRQLLKFHQYAFKWENYLLLTRVIRTALLVRSHIQDQSITPKLVTALPSIDSFYLTPQPHWRISDAKKIAWFANWIVNFPVCWGRCLQRSLILYRLLNGYGEPARLCIGIDPTDLSADGHVWVSRLSDGQQAFAESIDPLIRYKVIYTSPQPK